MSVNEAVNDAAAKTVSDPFGLVGATVGTTVGALVAVGGTIVAVGGAWVGTVVAVGGTAVGAGTDVAGRGVGGTGVAVGAAWQATRANATIKSANRKRACFTFSSKNDLFFSAWLGMPSSC